MRDVYLEAVCKERSMEQQKRGQHMNLDEANWALLESRPLDGTMRRWSGSILLRLGRWLLSLAGHTRVEAAWRPAGPPRVARNR